MKKTKILVMAFLAMVCLFRANAQENDLAKATDKAIDNYLAVKDALATGDGNAASAKAKLLLASWASFPKKGLDATSLALLPKLEYDSKHISEVSLVRHQREHFSSLSGNIYTLLKKLKLNKSTLYWEYCTMEKKYYLSGSEAGKDPYMGMANCSQTKETLPATKQKK
jgi:hypothetical protein